MFAHHDIFHSVSITNIISFFDSIMSEGKKEGYGKIVKYWVVGSKEKSIVLKKEMCQFKLKVITLQ